MDPPARLDLSANTIAHDRALAALIAFAQPGGMPGRGLNSSTFGLNVSASCGIGGAFRGCLGDV